MAEKKSAVQSLACGLAQIALGSTYFVEEERVEPACPGNPKCHSATNSPQGSPPAQQKFNILPKSASLDVLVPEDKNSGSKGTNNPQPPKPRRFHSYQPGKGGYEDHKHKEGLLNFLHNKVHRKKSAEYEYSLHHPKNSEALMELLRVLDVDSNSRNEAGDAPIHAIVKHKRGNRLDLLMTLLTHADVKVNLPGPDGNTALHFAVMVGEELLIKLLITFGASSNALNAFEDTPLDLALQSKQMKLVDLLVSVGSTTGEVAKHGFYKLPRMRSFHDSSYSLVLNKNGSDFPDGQDGEWNGDVESRDRVSSTQSSKSMKIGEGVDSQIMYDQLHHCVNHLLEGSGSFSANTDEAIAVTMQQRELLKYKKTKKDQRVFSMKGGSRILCLDGGGIRGLIQIEVLRQIEQATGRQITELFDWIVATSTGGVIALAMVYAKKTLCQLRQLYFKLKDEVFSSDRIGFAYNTEALEKLLMEELGTEMTMSDVKFPRVLITAVNKRTTVPELHFFNNCFADEFSTQPIWKVARYTSAAPMFFTEFEDYVDGGVLANNPCESGLTAIQNYYRQKGLKLDIALVVSVGTGIFPPEVLGKTDAQQFLFFGTHWFKLGDTLKKRAHNLILLLTTALVESESVAQNTRSRLIEQGIPFCRFNPHLDEAIPAGETDIEKLLNMTLQSRIQTMGHEFDELIQLFHLVAELNRQLEIRKKYEARIKSSCVN